MADIRTLGHLTPEEAARAQAWLKTHWKHWQCPFSGHNDWEIGSFLAQAPSYRFSAGQVYPFLVVTCKGCGYVVFVNAIWAGIVPPVPPGQLPPPR